MRLFLLILLLPLSLQAQISHAFFELKHGMTMEQVHEIMFSKEGITPNVELSSTDCFIYANSQIDSDKVPYIKLEFVDNKYHTGRIFITPYRAPSIYDVYDNLKNSLIKLYGKPNLDKHKIFPPYNKYAKKKQYFAVYNELVLYHTKWELYKKRKEPLSVEMYIDDCFYIIILMRNLELYQKADNQEYSKMDTLDLLNDL